MSDSLSEPECTEGTHVQLLGRTVPLHNAADAAVLASSVARLEKTFRDMERAYELRWGSPPRTLDTSTWVLMGALNLAHQVVRLEQEASQHTYDLEQTLVKLLDDVPDDTPAVDLPPPGLDDANRE